MIGIKRDYVYRDAKNRKLGLTGELAALEYEKKRLFDLGHADLATRVEHVSQTVGDRLGYDIRSFETSGAERHIEVKTTLYGAETPFFVSRNEVSASDYFADSFHLYRIFRLNKKAEMYVLKGTLTDSCTLHALDFIATPRTHFPDQA